MRKILWTDSVSGFVGKRIHRNVSSGCNRKILACWTGTFLPVGPERFFRLGGRGPNAAIRIPAPAASGRAGYNFDELGRTQPCQRAAHVAFGLAGPLGKPRLRRPGASVLVVVMDPNFMAEYMGLAAELRAAGVAAELYMGEGRVGAQLRYADRRGLPAVVICGENEFASNEVSVKDLAVGRKLAQGMSDRKQWQEERPAQVTIPRGELVATVRRIIDGE